MDTDDKANLFDRRRLADRWHIARDIPISVILVLMVQTGGMVWSVAQLYERVDTLISAVHEMKSVRYTRDDALREREFLMQIMENRETRDKEVDRRLSALENTIQKHVENNGYGQRPR